MKTRLLLALLLCAALPGFGRPAVADPLLSAIVGTGSNTSYLVLDFRGGTGVEQTSYAFAYRYDGAQTAGDLLDALVGANIGFTAGYEAFPFGRFFTSFGYDGNLLSASGFPDYWAFWDSTDGFAWNSTDAGPDDFVLTNGGYVGYSYAPQYPSDNAPVTPQAGAVPEASTLALGTLGLAVLGAVARRCHA